MNDSEGKGTHVYLIYLHDNNFSYVFNIRTVIAIILTTKHV